MHSNAALLRKFYDAFSRRDAATMAACYAPDVRFSDPVFTDLRGAEAGAMWAMLCERGRDLELTLVSADAGDEAGTARWEARYTVSQTGRKVHNVIDARFRFASGLIVEHVDSFPLWRWTRQALGVPGVLLGWSPLLQGTLRRKARQGLSQWRQGRA